MNKFAVWAVLLLSPGFAAAEEFMAGITKVIGDKVTLVRFPGPGEKRPVLPKDKVSFITGHTTTLTAAPSCKVVKLTKPNKQTKEFEGIEAVEGGLKNELFTTTYSYARVATDAEGRVTQIGIFASRPKDNNDFIGAIKSIADDKITVLRGNPFSKGLLDDADTFAVDDKLKVVKGKVNAKTKSLDAGEPLKGGLKHPVFQDMSTDIRAFARFIIQDNKLVEIRYYEFTGEGP